MRESHAKMFNKYSDISFKDYGIFVAAVSILAICLLVLAFSFQGLRGIWQPDEGYYAGTAVTMLSKGNFFIPYLGEDEIFLDKPPMIYWGIIAGLKLFGHSEFAVRFFHGLCFFLTSLAVGTLSFSMFKDKWLGLLSSLVYATMIIPFFAANFVTPDTILTLWTTLSALCFWNSVKLYGAKRVIWQMLLYAAAGFGFLAKGPAVLIPFGGMFLFLSVRKEMRRYFLTPWSVLGFLVFLAIGLSWYIWIGFKIPGAFSYFIDNQILGRLISEKYNRNPGLTGALIYLPVLIFGSLPWSIIWLEKVGLIKDALLKKKSWVGLKDKPEILFLLSYFLVPLIILCLASSKLGLYALPIFVPLAIATASLWGQKVPDISCLSLQILTKSFSRPIKLTFCWISLLLLSKLAVAYYPTNNDMRTLWAEVKKYMPPGNYELCTVNKRADGLLFYGVQELEHLTVKSNPYPTFTPTEHISQEIREFVREKEVFLTFEKDEIDKIIEALKKSKVEYRLVYLSSHKALIFPVLPSRCG